ncbi:MAG: hypothetical protein MZV63_21765 [Marinilabiliales bacterium]|nr:hypothetical protein [Marinilabiliales bacterium]
MIPAPSSGHITPKPQRAGNKEKPAQKRGTRAKSRGLYRTLAEAASEGVAHLVTTRELQANKTLLSWIGYHGGGAPGQLKLPDVTRHTGRLQPQMIRRHYYDEPSDS